MTGAEIKRIFYSKYDEITGGILSPQRLNDQFNQSAIEYFEPLIRKYGETGAINDELRCLFADVTVSAPSNYQILFTSLPNYQAVSSVRPSYTLNGQTYIKTATLMPINAMDNSYSNGKVYAPRYEVKGDYVQMYPQEGTVNSVEINYLRTTIPIDVEDAVTDLAYSEQSVMGIIDQMISIYAASLGDMEAYNVAERSEIENTNIIRK
jgi:hypothetical protein